MRGGPGRGPPPPHHIGLPPHGGGGPPPPHHRGPPDDRYGPPPHPNAPPYYDDRDGQRPPCGTEGRNRKGSGDKPDNSSSWWNPLKFLFGGAEPEVKTEKKPDTAAKDDGKAQKGWGWGWSGLGWGSSGASDAAEAADSSPTAPSASGPTSAPPSHGETPGVTAAVDISDLPEGQICVICMSGERQYSIVPCGHRVLCATCKDLQIPHCPTCRGPCHSVMRVYL
jgi:hypothetical protein